MSDDLATQLREQASSDHVRGCEGRQYSCDCGYDIRGEGLLEQAAQALTEARAEIERLRAKPPLLDARSLPGVDALVKTLEARLDEALRSCLAEREGRLKAESELADTKDDFLRRHKDAVDRFERIGQLESELSTLRARVRDVVGPFAEDMPRIAVIEAIRQLLEEVNGRPIP